MNKKITKTKKTYLVADSDIEQFLKWKHQVAHGERALGYSPLLEQVTHYFSQIDTLSAEAKKREPVEIDISAEVVSAGEAVKDICQQLTTLFRRIESKARTASDNQDVWNIIESIESLGITLHSHYARSLLYAEELGVNTEQVKIDFESLETALGIRDEFVSLQGLPDHQSEHLRWRQISVTAFLNTYHTLLRSIESESRKPAWIKTLKLIAPGRLKQWLS